MKMEYDEGNSLPNSKLIELFQRTHEESLQKNEESTQIMMKNKAEYVTLKSQLETIPNKLLHEVMVPIGSRALMRGKMVHTNEVLVCLGDGWFVKQSAKLASEICDRRIESCTEILSKLQVEKDLLTSRKQLPIEQNAFGNDIVEPYDEKTEAAWRIEHRQKERSYRQQLAEQRVEETVDDEDRFWEKLERLELQEELEEELERLHKKRANAENVQASESRLQLEEESSKGSIEKQTAINDEKPRRRVSFADVHTESSNDSDSSNEPLVIEFSHTPSEKLPDQPESPSERQSTILSPADIYNWFPRAGIKSILKQNSNKSKHSVPTCNPSSSEPVVIERKEKVPSSIPLVFGDVLEHQTENEKLPSETINIETKRPVSRFRAARQLTK